MAWTCECGATFYDGNVRIGQTCPACRRIVVAAEVVDYPSGYTVVTETQAPKVEPDSSRTVAGGKVR